VDALILGGRELAVRLSMAFLLACGQAHAQVASEATVKAAFLYKFAGYVEWPPTAFAAPDAPLVIAVSGAEDVAAELERLVPGRAVNGRPVNVRRMNAGDPSPPHIVFVGRADPRPRATIRGAQQQGALTITEGGLELGGVINFVPVEDRIGFEVSLDSAEKSGVRISARLLPIARRVVPRP
jgi:hypothetical protein